MKITKHYNVSLGSVKSRLSKKGLVKVFPVSMTVLGLSKSRFSIAWKKIISLSMQRINGLRNRLVIAQRFIDLLLRLKKNHGTDFTIKWLKACYVAIQKAQAGDVLPSLRSLEPGLPLPRLVNGIPAFIGPMDRAHIRKGNPSVIRFWSSLFSIYRVLKCSYKLKIGTIVNPFSGDSVRLEEWTRVAKNTNVFSQLESYKDWQVKTKLAPQKFNWGNKASPSNKIAWHGIFSELMELIPRSSDVHPIMENIENYLNVLHKAGHNTNTFRARILNGQQIIGNLFEVLYDKLPNQEEAQKALLAIFPSKKSKQDVWGQISLKEEAAGKLRLFALVDNLTQSILRPLHDSLFDLLRQIPNDGTFDQDKSVKRSAEKAAKYSCAYSFDLSAATDRLPAVLSAAVLSTVVGIPIGDSWLQLLTKRRYYLNPSQIKKYEAPVSYVEYSVGQPMGALSSWAMLAITHHWMLQIAAANMGDIGPFRLKTWEERYEILGDDLTIFDPKLADSYLRLCKDLGVEINLTKSIVSPSKPVFEFAKRTYNEGVDVSPIPFKPLINPSLADTVGLTLQYSEKGLISRLSVLKRLISRFGSSTRKELGNPILAILGALVSKKLIPHRWLVESLVDPKNEDFDLEESDLKVPQVSSLKLILDALSGKPVVYPFSQQEVRNELFDDYEDEFANVVANRALFLGKKLETEYESILDSVRDSCFPALKVLQEMHPNIIWSEIPEFRIVLAQAHGFCEDNFLNWDRGLDPVEEVDKLMGDPKFYYRRGLTLDLATEHLQRIERLDHHFRIERSVERQQTKVERPEILVSLGMVVKGTTSQYWNVKRWDE